MITILSESDAQAVPDVAIREAIEARMVALSDGEPYDADALGPFLLCEDGDSLESVRTVLGFSPVENRYSGSLFGQADFTPSFEVIEDHGCCFELVFVLSDDGSGALVFIPKGTRIDPLLMALCEHYAIRAEES